MEKEAFNRKRSIFCGPLEKELRKRLVKCFVWSVMVQKPGHYDGMSKNDWKILRCGMEKDGECKMGRQNQKNVGEGRIMLELIRKGKRNWLGYWLRQNCLL